MTDSRILVLGGGINQIAVAKEARQRGALVIVTDSNENPPAKVVADYFYQVDTTKKAENLRIAKHHQISAVVTDQSDAALPTAAYVAAEMNLPGIPPRIAEVFTNKFLMRKILSKNSSPYQPSYFEKFTQKPKALNFLNKFAGNLDCFIVKPVDSQGSKGVSRLSESDSTEQIERAFHESRSGAIIIEEFVPGEEFSVDSVVVDSNVTCLAIGRKEHYATNNCLDQRIVFLGSYLDEYRGSLVRANQEILAQLGLRTGLAHAEFIVTENRILLVEAAARGGGAGISSIIAPHISDFDSTKFLLDSATGTRHIKVEAPTTQNRSAILHFFNPHVGLLTGVEVGDAAKLLCSEFHLNTSRLTLGAEPRDSRSRIGHFVVLGESYPQTLARESAVLEAVVFKHE